MPHSELVKTHITASHPQSVWFTKSRVGGWDPAFLTSCQVMLDTACSGNTLGEPWLYTKGYFFFLPLPNFHLAWDDKEHWHLILIFEDWLFLPGEKGARTPPQAQWASLLIPTASSTFLEALRSMHSFLETTRHLPFLLIFQPSELGEWGHFSLVLAPTVWMNVHVWLGVGVGKPPSLSINSWWAQGTLHGSIKCVLVWMGPFCPPRSVLGWEDRMESRIGWVPPT